MLFILNNRSSPTEINIVLRLLVTTMVNTFVNKPEQAKKIFYVRFCSTSRGGGLKLSVIVLELLIIEVMEFTVALDRL